MTDSFIYHSILTQWIQLWHPQPEPQYRMDYYSKYIQIHVYVVYMYILCYLHRKEGEYICEELAKTNRLRCIDLVEVNPTLSDLNGVNKTAQTAIQLLQHCVGKFSNHHQTLITP